MKRIISFILTAALLLTATALNVSADTTNEELVIERELFKNLNIVNTESLDTEITRGEFASYIVKMMNAPGVSSEQIFSDVNDRNKNFGYINAANIYGLMNGVSIGEFAPDS